MKKKKEKHNKKRGGETRKIEEGEDENYKEDKTE